VKILIADDDPQILRALRITLTARGYEILTASDGRTALNSAIEHSLAEWERSEPLAAR